ncbi:ferric siderophore transport system, periplasmic binding protein TonB [Filimonas lacunae]|nr:ferric siderophore transport system, periplasmic binding protein TonB [Filimonas lacunae]
MAVVFCGCTSLFAQQPVAAPAKDTTRPKRFDTVQVQASFPGGDDAWRKFLENNLDGDVPVRKKAPAGLYKVLLSFLVGKDGKVYEVKVEEDPGFGTAAEALRVFKKSPRWNPAIVDDKPVIYRQRQSITFFVEEEVEPVKKKKRD